VVRMSKHVIFFSHTADALARFVENPSDPKGPVSQLLEGVGGRLESYLTVNEGAADGATGVYTHYCRERSTA
jgi:hypothetical protein